MNGLPTAAEKPHLHLTEVVLAEPSRQPLESHRQAKLLDSQARSQRKEGTLAAGVSLEPSSEQQLHGQHRRLLLQLRSDQGSERPDG